MPQMPTPTPATSDNRLIVALDQPRAASERLAETLGDAVGFYKVGLGMLHEGGPAFAQELKARGKRVFLDLKLFDIGATVEAAVRRIATTGVDFLTVHGDPPVVEAAARGAQGSATRILAVTVLTSLDRGDLDTMMITPGAIDAIGLERARRAFDAGAGGVIASPLEAAAIRALPAARGRLIVTPGVRPAGADSGDQKRIATPAGALAAGADHIVIGRPVHSAPDPLSAARAILAEIAGADHERGA